MAFLSFACGNRMPKDCPDDLKITLSDGGGMIPFGQDWEISKDSAAYEVFFEGQNNRWTFVPEADSIAALYQRLRNLDFGTIGSEDRGLVYDRGGTSLRLSSKTYEYEVADNGNMFVREKDGPRYRKCIEEVQRFVMNGVEGKKIPLRLEILTDIALDSIERFSISVDEIDILNIREQAPPQSIEHKLLPGNRMLNCSLKLLGNPSYAYIHSPIAISAENNAYQISISSTSFELHPKN